MVRWPVLYGILCGSGDPYSTEFVTEGAPGRGTSALRYGKSLACREEQLDDWEEHYVGIFIDRDMFMRYTHFGIGHSPMLRRIMRDCLVSKSAAQLDGVGNCSSEEADREFEEVGDDNGYEEYADEEVE
ncbi:hypothetical protein P692DRAFT_201873924 [Suillus brevipes Sb2]|nr:hypothetical protein P692DRAFT_201873924 [Suillus brevipes Sb2]